MTGSSVSPRHAAPALAPDRLTCALAPQSIAVIGASASQAKIGYKLMAALREGGYAGRVYPVNPRGEEIAGWRVYRAIGELPEPVDLAAIVVPANRVLEVTRECVAAGAGSAVVISSGFGEVVDDHASHDLEADVLAVARGAGMTLIGPNCEGILSSAASVLFMFSTMFDLPRRHGPISYVSQSGAYAGLVYRRLQDQGLGFADVVSSGNEADVTALELIEHWAARPDVDVILAHLEEIRDARRFMRVMPEITRQKPVIINKVGYTEGGQRAAASHTGALAGSDTVVDAALRQTGVVRTRNVEEFVDVAAAVASQPLLRGNRVAIISTAGGLTVETADLCNAHGFAVPQLAKETIAHLDRVVPYYGATRNPIDLTAAVMTDVDIAAACVAAVAEDPGIDAVAVVLTGISDPRLARSLAAVFKMHDKPTLVCWTAGAAAGEGVAVFTENAIPVYSSPLGVVRALIGLRQFANRSTKPLEA